ncbi:MAG TPA: hypothetical protein P5089_00920 [Candidatus Portnoybacteria bacterium]|nr:hypothetical protein [Candidatus Portnoybacteria bacterium]
MELISITAQATQIVRQSRVDIIVAYGSNNETTRTLSVSPMVGRLAENPGNKIIVEKAFIESLPSEIDGKGKLIDIWI